ncbi:MAG: hypothetical protein OZSIB_3585 [Candidatus Ozemobacter sibiricus]|uniref:Uncharacterized protein n=1 Tax=Candidatus Ozemobacter sibiricus TaxID=2268124 RepID=A0A367ZRW1_9BACT|nr:MAG: hypothetical protein OZSIB_3585 [Candidatus Ozemobacter sibiricus]
MDRTNLALFTVILVLLLLSRVVFGQTTAAPGGSAVLAEAMPGSATGPTGREGSEAVIEDEMNPDSPDPWDRVRDIFRPYDPDAGRKKPQPLIAPPVEPPPEPAATGPVIVEPDKKSTPQGAYVPTLQGILITSDKDRIAILDDTFVRVGDVIAGWEVRQITRTTVVLKGEKEETVREINR